MRPPGRVLPVGEAPGIALAGRLVEEARIAHEAQPEPRLRVRGVRVPDVPDGVAVVEAKALGGPDVGTRLAQGRLAPADAGRVLVVGVVLDPGVASGLVDAAADGLSKEGVVAADGGEDDVGLAAAVDLAPDGARLVASAGVEDELLRPRPPAAIAGHQRRPRLGRAEAGGCAIVVVGGARVVGDA